MLFILLFIEVAISLIWVRAYIAETAATKLRGIAAITFYFGI